MKLAMSLTMAEKNCPDNYRDAGLHLARLRVENNDVGVFCIQIAAFTEKVLKCPEKDQEIYQSL